LQIIRVTHSGGAHSTGPVSERCIRSIERLSISGQSPSTRPHYDGLAAHRPQRSQHGRCTPSFGSVTCAFKLRHHDAAKHVALWV